MYSTIEAEEFIEMVETLIKYKFITLSKQTDEVKE